MTNVVKFRFARARGAWSRMPRRSKNGTPEERAVAAAMQAEIDAGQNEVIRSAQMLEFERLIAIIHPRFYPAALGGLRRLAERSKR